MRGGGSGRGGGGGERGSGRSGRSRREPRGGVCKLSVRGHCGKQPWSEAGASPVSRAGSCTRLSPSCAPPSPLAARRARGRSSGGPATMVSAGGPGCGLTRECTLPEAPAASGRALGPVTEQPRPTGGSPGRRAPVCGPAARMVRTHRGTRGASPGLSRPPGATDSFIPSMFAEPLVGARRGARSWGCRGGPGGAFVTRGRTF